MSWGDAPIGRGRYLRRAAVWLMTTAALSGVASAQTVEPALQTQPPGTGAAATDPLNPFNGAPTAGEPAPYGLPPAPVAPGPSSRAPFFFAPYVGLQEQFTDNAYLAATDTQSDLVTRGLAGMSAEANLGRLQGSFSGQVAYDWYARESSLNGKSLSGGANATYSLVPDRLWIETSAVVTNGYSTTFGESAVNRSGVNGRIQLATYQIGPKLAAPLGDFADLGLSASYGQVFYSDAGITDPLLPPLPPQDNVVQAGARIDTGERLGRLELLTTGQLEQDNHGFHNSAAVQSVYLAITPRVRLIARAGYERLYQSGEVDISAPLLSAGFELRPNADSSITLEGGERYKHTAWAAEVNYALSSRLSLTGYYRETIEPDQLFVAGTFADFVAQMAALPAQSVPSALTPQQNLYNQAAFAKNSGVQLAWRTERDQLTLAADWTDRRFFQLAGHDRSLSCYLSYDHRMRPDLTLTATLRTARTSSSPIYTPNEDYGGTVGLSYQLNSTSSLMATYAHSQNRQLASGGLSFAENVVLLAIQKRF